MALPPLPMADAKAMLEDPDWPLPERMRRRFATALAALAPPGEWIELRDEIQGYRDFCRYRDHLARWSAWNGGTNPDLLLEARRKRIRARIQARRCRRP